jgi:hypothetical protein
MVRRLPPRWGSAARLPRAVHAPAAPIVPPGLPAYAWRTRCSSAAAAERAIAVIPDRTPGGAAPGRSGGRGEAPGASNVCLVPCCRLCSQREASDVACPAGLHSTPPPALEPLRGSSIPASPALTAADGRRCPRRRSLPRAQSSSWDRIGAAFDWPPAARPGRGAPLQGFVVVARGVHRRPRSVQARRSGAETRLASTLRDGARAPQLSTRSTSRRLRGRQRLRGCAIETSRT